MADVKFVHSSGGYIALMQSGEMRGVLHEYADGIYGAANGAISEDKGTPLNDPPYAMHDFSTSERAGVRISTANDHSIYAEAKHGHLQNAAGV